jgi:malate dehydrogenase (oxaloacetate-decarboxylating)
MKELLVSLDNLDECFPENFSNEQISKGKTLFYKNLAIISHQHYGGKLATLPKVGVWGKNWYNVWYTPGVSSVSISIKDNEAKSFELSNRGNLVAVVSDSTRVLGDGDCGASGGLGVMEGKAFLMKTLADVDAVPLCINNRNSKGEPDVNKIIDFVKMIEPSFGAVNLEDISQPNCYKVLDVLREECDIPVWHDDAQGTACVILAGILNSVILAQKKLSECRIVLLGAGASSTTVARLLILAGANPNNTIIFSSKGGLHKNRKDYENDDRFYIHWDLCQKTNPKCVNDFDEGIVDADILIALSTPGPDVIKKEHIKKMAKNSIVFVCANPVPEIYPYAAKEAGAFIVATGRGDFANQVNNSLGFPGILKGALLCRAKKITDNMAIEAAKTLADYARKQKFDIENILPTMQDSEVFAIVAEAVAQQAIKDKVARVIVEKGDTYKNVLKSINEMDRLMQNLYSNNFIDKLSQTTLQNVLNQVIETIK